MRRRFALRPNDSETSSIAFQHVTLFPRDVNDRYLRG